MAGWREFCENPLPCFGLVEVVNDFVPFTGRASASERSNPASRSHDWRPEEHDDLGLVCTPVNGESTHAYGLEKTVSDSKSGNMYHNLSPDSPPSPPAMSPGPQPASLFSVTHQEAASMVKECQKEDKSRHCYLLQIMLMPLYSHDSIPGSALRKLPRLVNRIPLGAGFLSSDQIKGINWRMLEGSNAGPTFISYPLLEEEAEDYKACLRDRLMKQAGAVFGDLTVKASITLSRCVDYSFDFILNDIAVTNGEGLHFRD